MRMITGVKMMSKQTDTTLEALIACIRGLIMSYLMGAKKNNWSILYSGHCSTSKSHGETLHGVTCDKKTALFQVIV